MDLNAQFKNFNETITLSKTKEEKLINSSDSIKNVINDYFRNKGDYCPKYHQQGSFPMDTTIQSISDKDYDIDIGVYLQGYEDVLVTNYPSTSTVHKWVFDATENQTKPRSNNKNSCVRVNYCDDYHIDLPIYIVTNTGRTLLAKINEGWVESDPVQFTNWFNEKAKDTNGQLKRVVRYIKAWRDYKKINILKSICINILVAENYVSNQSDHVSLLNTLENIILKLSGRFLCNKPVAPYENLFEDVNEQALLDVLKSFSSKLDSALENENIDVCNNITNHLFGDRFPKIQNINYKSDSPGVLKSDGRSGC